MQRMLRQRTIQALVAAGGILLLLACAGPDDRDDTDPTRTPAETPVVAAETNTPDDDAEREPTATESPSASPTATIEPTPTEVPATPTETPEPTATATATPLPVGLEESLPAVEDLPGEPYFLANQGTLSALDLANSYQDSSAHLERLDEWGFQQHIFREYTHESTGENDPLPVYVLTTVNEYGSNEQATDALAWLRSLNASQGQEFVDPDPDFGDSAFASSVETAEGAGTAIVYVQIGPRVYAYFAQGGVPLDFALELATANTGKIETASTGG